MDRNTTRGWPSVNRRSVLKGVFTAGSLTLVGTAGAKKEQGPPDTKGCDVVVPHDNLTIQAGVDAAAAGETVCVKASGGPYTEQVVVDKDLTLRGVNNPTIQAPKSPGAFTIPESGPTWEPVIFAYGGSESGGDVSGSATVDVTVTGFTVDGGGSQPDARRAAGILTRNVVGDVSENTVTNMGVGGKETFGILTYGDSDLRIWNNDVRDYERGGIGAVGDGDAHPGPNADIRGNTVTGSTGIGEAWGPNGIEIGFGASGTIIDNEVSDNRYAETASTAAGIIVFESNSVQVRGNTVTNSDVGIANGSWGWFQASADDTKIVNNDVTKANAGVLLQAVAFDGLSDADPTVRNVKVTNNTISDPVSDDDDTGVAVEAIDADPDFDPAVTNNKVIHNTITGFSDRISDDGLETKIRATEP